MGEATEIRTILAALGLPAATVDFINWPEKPAFEKSNTTAKWVLVNAPFNLEYMGKEVPVSSLERKGTVYTWAVS